MAKKGRQPPNDARQRALLWALKHKLDWKRVTEEHVTLGINEAERAAAELLQFILNGFRCSTAPRGEEGLGPHS